LIISIPPQEGVVRTPQTIKAQVGMYILT
jgi:hypothetical protein